MKRLFFVVIFCSFANIHAQKLDQDFEFLWRSENTISDIELRNEQQKNDFIQGLLKNHLDRQVDYNLGFMALGSLLFVANIFNVYCSLKSFKEAKSFFSWFINVAFLLADSSRASSSIGMIQDGLNQSVLDLIRNKPQCYLRGEECGQLLCDWFEQFACSLQTNEVEEQELLAFHVGLAKVFEEVKHEQDIQKQQSKIINFIVSSGEVLEIMEQLKRQKSESGIKLKVCCRSYRSNNLSLVVYTMLICALNLIDMQYKNVVRIWA